MKQAISAALGMFFLAGLLITAASPPQPQPEGAAPAVKDRHELHYRAEWRLMRAGNAALAYHRAAHAERPRWEAALHLETTGFVGRLYKVDNFYTVTYGEGFCADATFLKSHEGRKRRETQVSFQKPYGKATYVEKDLIKDAVIDTKEIDVPPCVHDVISALASLRTMNLKLRESTELPISDGKKAVSARIEAQKLETVKTPAGTFRAIRYEAFLFNNVLYRRNGRLYVWLTDDERRLPVQIRIRLPFYIGTVTLELEKEETT